MPGTGTLRLQALSPFDLIVILATLSSPGGGEACVATRRLRLGDLLLPDEEELGITPPSEVFLSKSWRGIRPSTVASLRKIQCEMRPGLLRLLIHQRRGRHVLQRRSSGVKDDDFVPRRAARFAAGDHLAELRVTIRPCN